MSGYRSKRGKGKTEDMDGGPGKRQGKKRRLSDSDDDERRDKTASPAVSKLGDLPNGMKLAAAMSSHNKPAELFRKDLISAMKLPDSEPLQPEDYILISDAWRQEWEKGVQVPVHPEGIPNASVNSFREKEKLGGDFTRPRKLLHAVQDEFYKQGIHELTGMQQLAEQVCRYDLDELDVQWLKIFNEERQETGNPPVHEWIMETVIEELETQCHENMQATIKTSEGMGIEYDENVVCDVCRSPDSEDCNEMVFCDKCDICVHQACYGISKIPTGSWLCRTCALGIKPQCILCPKKGGAMKSTKSGTKWAHVSCALWIPEVSIGDAEKMEPITKISHIPSSRWALVCCLCRERNIGSCIQCSVKTCKTAFHVTCAFQHQLEMKTILDDEDEEDVKLKAYCQKHSKKSGRTSGSDSEGPGSPRSVGGSPRKELTKLEKENLRMHKIELLEAEFYSVVKIKDVADKLKLDEAMVDFIYEYWKLKRKCNFNKALMMPKTEEEDMLNKQQEDSLIARMKMFVHLRQDLERVRNLCYMVSRREKIRRSYFRLKEDIFYKQVDVVSHGPRLSGRELNHVIQQGVGTTLYDQYVIPDNDFDVSPSSPSSVKENRLSPEKLGTKEIQGMETNLQNSPRTNSRKEVDTKDKPAVNRELNGLIMWNNKYKVDERIKQKAQSRVFRNHRNRLVNGTRDKNQRSLDSFFVPIKKEDQSVIMEKLRERYNRTPKKPVTNGLRGSGKNNLYRDSPRTLRSDNTENVGYNSPETRSAKRRIDIDLDTYSNDRLFANVDSEISICVSSRDTTPDREVVKSLRSSSRKGGIDFNSFDSYKQIKRSSKKSSTSSDGNSSDSVDNDGSDSDFNVSSFPRRMTRSRVTDDR